MEVKPLTPEEEERQKQRLKETPLVQPWMINALQNPLPYLVDKQYAKKILEQCNGNLDQAVSKLLDSEDGASSAQESSSIEREPDSDDDSIQGPYKKRDRRTSKASRRLASRLDGSLLAVPHTMSDNDGSQESLGSFDSDVPSSSEASQHSPNGTPFAHPDTIVVNTHPNPLQEDPNRKTIRININPPKPPPEGMSHGFEPRHHVSKRISARDRKDMKKMAQKAARKERQQAAARGGVSNDAMKTGMELRSKGMTSTPVIESGFRTLFI